MNTSERFLRFAAECELMAKSSPSRESRLTWKSLAERWVRCAELVDRHDPVSRRSRKPSAGVAQTSH
jgi:hypothetical protein